MADHFPFKSRRATTIAVTGLPYTFRKEMGKYISKWAKCPNLTFEVILKALPNNNRREDTSESESESESEEEQEQEEEQQQQESESELSKTESSSSKEEEQQEEESKEEVEEQQQQQESLEEEEEDESEEEDSELFETESEESSSSSSEEEDSELFETESEESSSSSSEEEEQQQQQEDEDGGVVNINDPSDVAFNILCETGVSLLDRYQRNCVVINFPIPTIPQLEKLIRLHDGSGRRRRRLLIIECQRRNKFLWRQAVKHPSRGTFYNKRYLTVSTRPGKWRDVEKAIQKHQQQQQGLDACLLGNNNNVYVKNLVVDPFQDLRTRDFTQRKGLDTKSLFAQAIKDYLACDDDEYRGSSVNLDYSEWRRKWLEKQAEANSSRRGTGASGDLLWLCEAGDCILRFTNNLKGDPICKACQHKVTEGQGAYYCQLCSLSLHQLCAVAQSTSTANTTAKRRRLTRSKVVRYYSWARASELFPTEYERSHINDACYPCKREGKPFSWRKSCNGCVYKAHLKAQLLPTAFNHSCDKHHFLSIRLSWLSREGSLYDCKACGLRGQFSSYSCNICNLEYHLECMLKMPLQTNGNPKHGDHTHNMEIRFRCGEKEYEYEWCPVCYYDINPDTWVYTCQHSDCDFVAHLYCIFPSNTFKRYKKLTVW